ncbi:MAG: hypothetical protein F4X77_02760 [Acidobacteriia bacterium]|nr:hypothetical protein [Terriglobia bacterium]
MTDLEEVLDWRRDDALDAVPNCGGIFVVEFPEGLPYLGRTAALRKRLRRLLRPADSASTRLTLREIATRVHYRRTGSAFESDVALYRAVKRYRPGESRDYLKLRPAFYVKLLLGNRFPRSCVTRQLTRGKSLFYGPFPNRNAAEEFHNEFLDLFLVRRCTENLDPSPFHPGCVWGEMGRCMRPCQAACGDDAYAREAQRMALFLETDGESLLCEAELSRDNASKSLDFEAAARFHKLVGRTKQVLRLRAALSSDLGSLHGVVLQRSAAPACLQLTAVHRGSLQVPVRLHYDQEAPTAADLNAQIRAALSNFDWLEASTDERQDHLALLQRWHASSFRKGEFVPFADISALPWRRLANAALRVALGRDRTPRDTAAEPRRR